MIEETEGPFSNFGQHVKDYVNTKLELLKLQSIEKGSFIASAIIIGVIFLFLLLFFLVHISIAIGFFLGSLLGSYALGFGLTALFFLLLMIFLFVFKKKFIFLPIVNTIIKFAYSGSDKDEHK